MKKIYIAVATVLFVIFLLTAQICAVGKDVVNEMLKNPGFSNNLSISLPDGSVNLDPENKIIKIPGISLDEDGISTDIPGFETEVNNNVISLNGKEILPMNGKEVPLLTNSVPSVLGEPQTTSSDADDSVNIEPSSNNTQLYVIIGLIFFVLFLVMVFGFIAIKKQKGQIVTKKD